MLKPVLELTSAASPLVERCAELCPTLEILRIRMPHARPMLFYWALHEASLPEAVVLKIKVHF